MKYSILVNKNNEIKDSYINKINLVETKNIKDEIIKVEEKTYEAYKELKKFLETKNIFIELDSAYRSIEEQQEIIDEFTEKYGTEYVNKFVAPIRTSEHHTGLALDLALIVNNKSLIENEDLFANEDIFLEIHKHLHKFGFILRYPTDKKSITGYDYEPWHIRYIGKIPAKIIYDNSLTLEEYLNNFSCVLYINKPKDITSFDVVNKISKLFGIKRVGHTGTLDPLATGVMLITIGKATKIVELLTAKDKEYIASFELGYKTDTYDNTGNILDKKEIPENINMIDTLNSFKKTYLQEVPIYSAIKVNGKKLYEYARENKDVELPKKEVTIKEIELLETKNNTYTIKTLVSKGTYIRSLINDIGLSLNTYATMTSLERTKQGPIFINDTNTLEDIENNNFTIHKIEDVLDYPIIEVDSLLEKNISNGMKINDNWNINDKVLFKNKENKLLGIYEKYDDILRVWKNFS